jgi:CBS domain-containing protein
MQAQDIMTRDVATVRPDATLSEAIALMLDRRVSGVPVVAEDRTLVGVLTEGDLLRRAETGTEKTHSRFVDFILGPGRLAAEYVRANSRQVSDLMTTDVVTVEAGTPLAEVVALMETRRIKRVPVVRDGAMVGLLSRSDLLRALGAALARSATPEPLTDVEIHDRIVTEFAHHPWARSGGITVDVIDGVVVLEGSIMDDRDRAAMKVVAQNVAGVRAVRDELTWVEPMSGATFGPTI